MIDIPLEILNLQDDGFHLLVNVIVFDKHFKAVLDTGASKTVFDKSTVEKYLNGDALQMTDRVSTGLGTVSMESFTWVLPDLQIGEFHLKKYEVAILDLSSINFAYQNLSVDPVIGVIGGDILMQYGAIINYPKCKLTLRTRRLKRYENK